MSVEGSVDDAAEFGSLLEEDIERGDVAEQLQRVYEHLLNDRRPEAVGSTEKLADQLGIDVQRPDGFPGRVRR